MLKEVRKEDIPGMGPNSRMTPGGIYAGEMLREFAESGMEAAEVTQWPYADIGDKDEAARVGNLLRLKAKKAKGVKVILLTPTPDLSEDIRSDQAPLQAYAQMIRRLAAEYHVGLADSYAVFRAKAEAGEKMASFMAQVNHPDARGHAIVAEEILRWFY